MLKTPYRLARKLSVIAVASCYSAVGFAFPTGPVVMHGQAGISMQGNVLNVVNTPGTVIHWNGFSIAANEIARFQQQSASSAVLNRVIGQDPSAILGQLQSNGRVFLINPNGILFGAGARVDVAGLVASTLNISDQDFLQGRMRFTGDGAQGAVINHAEIRTPAGGQVYLVAPRVENHGLITTPSGEIVLAAGKNVEIVDAANPNIRIELAAPENEAVNVGQLIAAGGRINIYAGLIRNAGQINANAAAIENGRIVLRRTAAEPLADERAGAVTLHAAHDLVMEPGGKVNADGPVAGAIDLLADGNISLRADAQLSANGVDGGMVAVRSDTGTVLSDAVIEARGAGGRGGAVTVTGAQVGLLSRSRINASGDEGGGTVLIGGDYQGLNAGVLNAQRTLVADGAVINADAGVDGNGGKVIVWADGDTRYSGSISARGAGNGEGGLVEVSGKQLLDFHGRIDVAAENGRGGRVLLDPQDILLNTSVQPTPPSNVDGIPDVAFGDLPDPGTYTIQVADVTGFSELYLQATRNITVANAVAMGAGNSVRLEANNNITVNAGATMTVSGAGSITLAADADNSGAGNVVLRAGLVARQGGVTVTAANVTSTAAGTITTTGAANQDAGDVSITASGTVNLLGAITATGGTATAGNPGRNGGTVTIDAAGISTRAITANGSAGVGAGLSQPGGAGGTIVLTSTAGITTGGSALVASGGAASTTNGNGGAGGTIAIANSGAGNVTTGMLTARTGIARGAGAGGAAGSITVTNTAGNISTTALNTAGNTKGVGGDITLDASGNVQVTGAIQTTGGGALGTMAGTSAGNLTITGVNRVVTGAITASGGAGLGANQAGGNAGAVSITGTGALNTAAITARNGNATGTGAGGTAGSITLTGSTVTAGALTTTGGSNGDAGNITATAASGLLNLTGNLTASGGAAITGNSGNDGGVVALTGVNVTALGLTASGSSGVGTSQSGGAGGSITIDSTGGVSTVAVAASGGNATAANGNGGASGTIAINNSVTGDVSTTTLTARNGAATGTGAGGAAGSIALTNTAGAISTTVIDTRGNSKGVGGNVALNASGALQVTGAIQTTGGAALGTMGGLGAGNVTITGTDRAVTGAITANGGAGLGANQAGGNAGVVSITGTGALNTAAITARNGNATGTGAGGTAGSITLTGSTVTAGALTTTGGFNGQGGNIAATAASGFLNLTGNLAASGGTARANNSGSDAGLVQLAGADGVSALALSSAGSAGNGLNQSGGNGGNLTVNSASGAIVVGAIITSGGNGGTGAANGGNAGATILDAGGATPTVTMNRVTSTGGNRTGAGVAGTGGNLTVNDAALLSANTTINTTGGSGIGVSGDVVFAGSIDSAVANRTLTINTTGATTLAGAIGAALPLTSLTLNAGGATSLGGNVTTTGNQSYGNPLTLTGNAVLTGVTPVFSSTVNAAGNDLTLDFSGLTTVSGATFSNIRNFSTGNGGTTRLTGTITTTGTQTYNDAVALSANTTLNAAGNDVTFGGTLDSQTATARTLAVNSTGTTTFGGAVGSTFALSSLTTNAGGATVINGGSVRTSGVQTYNDAVTLGADAVLTGTTPTFATVNAAGSNLTLDFSGTTTINGANFSNLAGLTTGNGGVTRLTGTITTTGAQTYNDAVQLSANTTLNAAGSDVSFGSTLNSRTATARTLAVNSTGTTTFGGAVGNAFALSSLTTNAGGTTAINGGSVVTAGAQAYNDAVTVPGAATLSAGGSISAAGTVTATGGLLTLNAGSGVALAGAGNDFATVQAAGGTGGVALTDANDLTLSAVTAGGSVRVVAGGDLTLNGAITTTATAAESIVLAAGGNLINNAGAAALVTGVGGTWLTYSSSPLLDTGGGLVSAFKHYNLSYTGAPYGGPGTGNGFIYDVAPVITPGLTGVVTRSYDGTATAALVAGNYATSGGIAGDVVTLNNPAAGLYDDRNAGTGKNVSVTGISIVGAVDGGGTPVYGYQLGSASANANVGTIIAAPLTVTAQTDSRGYDGTTSSAVGPVVSGTLYDAVGTAAAQTYDTKHVGTGKTLSASGLVVSDGNGGNNYAITYVDNTTGVIIAAPLTVTAQTDSRGYDGTTSSAVGPVVSGTLYDAVGTAAAQTYDTKHVGTGKTLSASGLVVSDGNGGNNYAITYVDNTTGVIIAAPLTVTAQTDSRGYDGTTSSAVGPVVSGTLYDAVGTAAAQTYDTKHVGTGKTLSASGLVVSDGNGGNNYAITYVDNTTGVIIAAPLTVTAQTDSRGYDGTTSSAVGPVVSGTLYDAVGTAAAQTYDTKHVGTGKTLSASGLVVSDGNGGNNYAITYVDNTTGVIIAAPLTVTAQTDSRGYDGTTSSAVGPVVSGTLYDAVGTAAAQTYDTKHVGTGKTLSASGLVVSDGNGGNNYAITYVDNTTGVIIAAPLTVTAQTDSRGYDGTTSSAVGPVVSGTLYDAVGTAAAQTYDTKHVGTGKTLSASGLVVSDGNGGNNYAITYVDNTTGVIIAAPLTVTAQTDSRGYDGTTSSAVGPVVSGTLYDAVGTAAAQTYDTKHVGTGKTLSASGLVVSDGNGGNNYAITYVDNTTGVIIAAPLTVTAQTDSRGYDGTTSSAVGPVVSGTLYDAVGTAAAQTYDTKHVGTGKTLSASGLVVSDGNGGNNYAITYVDNTTGVIIAAPLTVTVNDAVRGFGAPNPPFSVVYSGFGAGDTVADLGGSLIFSTPAVPSSPPGVYAIGAGGLTASNYSFTYVPGQLFVTGSGATVVSSIGGIAIQPLLSALDLLIPAFGPGGAPAPDRSGGLSFSCSGLGPVARLRCVAIGD